MTDDDPRDRADDGDRAVVHDGGSGGGSQWPGMRGLAGPGAAAVFDRGQGAVAGPLQARRSLRALSADPWRPVGGAPMGSQDEDGSTGPVAQGAA